jgi:hypothetical protein
MVEHLGFSATGSLFSLVGISTAAAIVFRWRDQLWSKSAAANLR